MPMSLTQTNPSFLETWNLLLCCHCKFSGSDTFETKSRSPHYLMIPAVSMSLNKQTLHFLRPETKKYGFFLGSELQDLDGQTDRQTCSFHILDNIVCVCVCKCMLIWKVITLTYHSPTIMCEYCLSVFLEMLYKIHIISKMGLWFKPPMWLWLMLELMGKSNVNLT
jgi:hypothetical protein